MPDKVLTPECRDRLLLAMANLLGQLFSAQAQLSGVENPLAEIEYLRTLMRATNAAETELQPEEE